jgi:hypothetical protein
MAAAESMEEWIRTMLEDQRCMDCKGALDEGEGTLEFQGTPPQVEFIGRLCEVCWQQRETIRRLRAPQP